MRDNLMLVSLLMKLALLNRTSNVNYTKTINDLQQWNSEDSPIVFDSSWVPNNPANYSVVENFINPIGWTGNPTMIVIEGGILQNLTGSTSFKLEKKFNTPIVVYENFILNLYIGDISLLNSLNVYFSNDESFTNYFYMDVKSKAQTGDNKIIVNRSKFLTVGTPSWNSVNTIRVTFGLNDQSKELSIITKKIETYTPRPLCTIWFDDGWSSVYTNAYPKMKTKGFVGVNAIVTSFINRSWFSTLDMLKEEYNYGWENTNHTVTHPYLTQISLTAAETEIKDAMNYLLNTGFSVGSFYFGPPYNDINDAALNILKKYAIVCRRVTNSYNLNPVTSLNSVGFKQVDNTTPPATVKLWIDEAIAHGYWLILIFHRIESPALYSTQYTPENFQQILDYLDLKRNTIDVVNVTQALMNMYGEI